MTEITRSAVARVGVDLSKRVFQVHAADRAGQRLMVKPMSPERFFAWCAELPVGCLVAMEACGGAHHVARRLRLMGLDARLIAGHFVTPYRMAGKSGKNDANDAAAICEAAGRPHMRFVPVKTAEQQGQLAVHRLREGFKEERTALINRIRGLLAEFGLVFPQSPDALRKVLAEVVEDATNELPGVARLALQRAHLHWIDIELQMHWCDERIACHVRTDDRAKAAASLQGIGPITASALVASVGDFGQFDNARQFRRLARPDTQPELHRRQGQPRSHHQTRRRLPAHPADPGRQVRRHERRQTQRPYQSVAGATQAACGLAEGRRRARKQERPHPVGRAHARRHLQPRPHARAASSALLSEGSSRGLSRTQRYPIPHTDVRSKMPTTGQTGGR